MKKFLIIIISLITITACKSSSGHCDAYGNKAASIDLINKTTV